MDVPLSVTRLVAALLLVYGQENVCIAGGYPRDWFLGEEPNDIDVWLPKLPLDKVMAAVDRMCGSIIDSRTVKWVARGETTARTNWVVEYYFTGVDIPVQLISTFEEEGESFHANLINNFSAALCQVALAPRVAIGGPVIYGLLCTQEFADDIVNDTYTCFGEEDTKHFAKMRERYEDDREFISLPRSSNFGRQPGGDYFD